jgi:hypothetical protein
MGPWMLAGLFVLVGGIFTALGYANLKSVRRKRESWVAVPAKVVSLAEVPGDKGRTLYAPVYAYWAGNAEHTVTATISSSPARYKVGDDLQVLVDPVNPAESELLDRTTAIFTWGLMAVGLFTLAIGGLVLWLVVTGQLRAR